MSSVQVIEVNEDYLKFDNGVVLTSAHESDCCEEHYLSFQDLSLEDFEGLEFNLNDFFEKIEDYGIALKSTNGWLVRIPGYGCNNGYYSANLTLVLTEGLQVKKSYDITNCQDITWE